MTRTKEKEEIDERSSEGEHQKQTGEIRGRGGSRYVSLDMFLSGVKLVIGFYVFIYLFSLAWHTPCIYRRMRISLSKALAYWKFSPLTLLLLSLSLSLSSLKICSRFFFFPAKSSRQPVLRRTLSGVAVRSTKSSRYLPNYYLRLSHYTRSEF